ncbi:unnamed protein product [Amoebophrya sp. A120]|nr:unnamed protein product [Amoebophrya sp. A120]|eukprot:GSA120T00005429001.1
MDSAISQLFHEWADPTSTPVAVTFPDLCCLLRWYAVFDPRNLTHLDLLALWDLLADDLGLGDDEQVMFEEELFPFLLKKVAAILYDHEPVEEGTNEDWLCEQLLNDLALAAPQFRNPEHERRARDQMRRFFGPVFESENLEAAYDHGGALAAIFTHYVETTTENEDEDEFLSTQRLERMCLDLAVLPTLVTHDTFLQVVHQYGEESYDFGQFVEVFLALLLSCEDEVEMPIVFPGTTTTGVEQTGEAGSKKAGPTVLSGAMSVPELLESLKIPVNAEYEKQQHRLPFLKKLQETEAADDEVAALAALAEADKLFEPLPPACDAVRLGKDDFTEQELAGMPMQPPPIEEVIAKAHAPKAKGKKGKKKKKKGDTPAFPRPEAGTCVWMTKRPLKEPVTKPPQWDLFQTGVSESLASRQKLRSNYVANWLLRPSLIDEPLDRPDEAIFHPSALALVETGSQHRNRGNLHAAFFSFWKALEIERGKLRAGDDKSKPFWEPTYTEQVDVIAILRELIHFVEQPFSAASAGGGGASTALKEVETFLLLSLATIATGLYLDALAVTLAFAVWKKLRNASRELDVLARKQLGTVLFRQGAYKLAARNFLTVVKMQEAMLGDCDVALAASYNNLATAYMHLTPFPRNREAVAYFTLGAKLMKLFAEPTHPGQPVFVRNLERAQEASRGTRFAVKPHLWYISLPGKPAKGKKKGKKKKK